jgi:uncharacterized protein YehS (DUF1456 family)
MFSNIKKLLIEHEYLIIATIKHNTVELQLPEKLEYPKLQQTTIKITIYNSKVIINDIEYFVENYAIKEFLFLYIMKQCLIRYYNPNFIVWMYKNKDVDFDTFFEQVAKLTQLTKEEGGKKESLEFLIHEYLKDNNIDLKKLKKQAKEKGVYEMFDLCFQTYTFKE